MHRKLNICALILLFLKIAGISVESVSMNGIKITIHLCFSYESKFLGTDIGLNELNVSQKANA